MDESKELEKTLDKKLSELESKASTVETLAEQVKRNEKNLVNLANSTISYISQLKASYNKKQITSNDLATKLIEQMNKISKKLSSEPEQSSISKTIDDLQNILGDSGEQSSSSSVGASDSKSKNPSSSSEKKEEKGILGKAMDAITNLVSPDSTEKDTAEKKEENVVVEAGKGLEKDVEKISQGAESQVDKVVKEIEGMRNQQGGYRYSPSKKYKKSTRTSKNSKRKTHRNSQGSGKKKKKSVSKKSKVKSHFTKTRKTSKV